MLDDIIAIGQRIGVCLTDLELAARLGERGYSAEVFKAASTRQEATFVQYNARTVAMAASDAAAERVAAVDADVRSRFQEVRDTAFQLFKDPHDKRLLQLSGRVSTDRQKLIGQVKSLCLNVQVAPYAAKLAERGIGAAKLAALNALLDTLIEATREYNIAFGQGVRATAERDAAYAALMKWHSEFWGIAKVATKDRPDLMERLKF